MAFSTTPANQMTSEERTDELAAILAHGILRLNISASSPSVPTSLKVSESRSHGLDVGGKIRLTGPTG